MSVFVEIDGSGPHLALLHGWGLNGAVWRGVRAALAGHFTLHIVDLPGHGRSGGVPVTTRDAMVEAVADVLPLRGHIMGWSLGGHTAMAIAHRHPERIDKLISVCATPRFTAAPDWPHGKQPEVLADFAKRLSTSYTATLRNFLALQALNQPEMRDVIRTLQEAVSAHGTPTLEGLAASLEILKSSDIRDQVPGIDADALVIQGDHDALTATSTARWLAANLPRAELAVIEHAAHAPFLSHRDAFLSRVLAFLQP